MDEKRETYIQESGLRWGLCGKCTELDYANDICLLAHFTRAMQIMLERIEKEATKVGLKINVNKSKEMRITMNNGTQCIHSETIESVTQFAQMGSIIDNADGTKAHTTACIQKTQTAFSALNKLWHPTAYSKQTKFASSIPM